MRIGTLSVLIFILGLVSSAQLRTHWTQAQNYGLEGPIHSQLFVTKKLARDPRRNPRLFVNSPQPWMVFDTNGYLIESGTLDRSGKLTNVQKMKVDQSGRTLESVMTNVTQTVHWRNQPVMGPHGPIEESTYLDGKLSSRTAKSYDEQGRETASDVYDGDGTLVTKAAWRYDEKGRVVEFSTSDFRGNAYEDMQDRYDAEGSPYSRIWFDESGRETMNITLRRDGSLSSWWRASTCKCSGSFGVNFADSVTKGYAVDENGKMEITIERHPGRYGNIENAEAERRSEDGQLLEKLAFRYERDHFGNWTNRVVSAWDSASGSMVDIEEDSRLLTYH